MKRLIFIIALMLLPSYGWAALLHDTSTESATFTTVTPFTFDHTPTGLPGDPRGVLVMIAHGTESTDLITSVTYGGVSMTRVASAASTTAEPGRSYAYFLGSSVPAGTQTISIVHTGAATVKIATCITQTAGADITATAVTLETDQQNPQIALDSGSNTALRYNVIYSGIGNPASLTLLSGMTALEFNDFGAFSERVDRQTTRGSGSYTIGYTSAASESTAMIGVYLTEGTFVSTNHYIRDGATGSSPCTAGWGDTQACDTLPSVLSRGDTYLVADGTYGSYTYDDYSDSTAIITIQKATTSSHGTDTGWVSTYGDGQAYFNGFQTFKTNYYTMTGVNRNQNNWKDSTSYGLHLQADCDKLVSTTAGFPASNIILSYIYFQGNGADIATCGNDIIYGVNAGANWHIHHNYLYYPGRVDYDIASAADNWIIEYNYHYRNENVPTQHSEAIQTLGNADSGIVRFNVWEANEGTGVIVLNDITGWEIYGNVFFDYNENANGVIAITTGYSPANVKIYNNTIVDSDCAVGSVGGTAVSWTAYNNIFFGCLNGDGGPSFGGGVTHDYNATDGVITGEANKQEGLTSSIFVNYIQDNFTLLNPTNAGTTFSSPYNTDIPGLTRGSDGAWDRGAYEYSVPAGTPSKSSIRNILRLK